MRVRLKLILSEHFNVHKIRIGGKNESRTFYGRKVAKNFNDRGD